MDFIKHNELCQEQQNNDIFYYWDRSNNLVKIFDNKDNDKNRLLEESSKGKNLPGSPVLLERIQMLVMKAKIAESSEKRQLIELHVNIAEFKANLAALSNSSHLLPAAIQNSQVASLTDEDIMLNIKDIFENNVVIYLTENAKCTQKISSIRQFLASPLDVKGSPFSQIELVIGFLEGERLKERRAVNKSHEDKLFKTQKLRQVEKILEKTIQESIQFLKWNKHVMSVKSEEDSDIPYILHHLYECFEHARHHNQVKTQGSLLSK